MMDERELCDPCSQGWEERTDAVSYAGADLRQAPHYDGTALETQRDFGTYTRKGLEDWRAGDATIRPYSETCRDLMDTSTGRNSMKWDVKCTPRDVGQPLTPEYPIFCEAGVAVNGIRTVGCNEEDVLYDAQDSSITVYDGFLLPCLAAERVSSDSGKYTAIQACCRCGGGKYSASVPPPPAPLPTTAEAMCTALPGCCYDATMTCARSVSPSYTWINGEKVAKTGSEIPLTGCCFSPDWTLTLDTQRDDLPAGVIPRVQSTDAPKWPRVPTDVAQDYSILYPTATCSSSWTPGTDWPLRDSAWTKTSSAMSDLPGVDLVFCKYISTATTTRFSRVSLLMSVTYCSVKRSLTHCL